MHPPHARNPVKWVEILLTGGLALTGVVGIVGGARMLRRVGRGPGGIVAGLWPETAIFAGPSPGEQLVLGAKRAGAPVTGGTSNGMPSFLNPCGEARMIGAGVPRYTTLVARSALEVSEGSVHPMFPDTRDVCEGGTCRNIPTGDSRYWSNEPGVSGRPYNYFDHELHALHLSRGMAGAEAIRKSMRTMGCVAGRWRPLPSMGAHHSCPAMPYDGFSIEYRGQTMECRDGKWKRPGE